MILTSLGLLATAVSSSLFSSPTSSGFNSAGLNSYNYGNGFYTYFDYDIVNTNLDDEYFYFTDSETGNRYAFARTKYTYNSSTGAIQSIGFIRTQDFTSFFRNSNFTCFGIFRFQNSSNTTLDNYYTMPFVLDDYYQGGSVEARYKLYPYTDTTFTYSSTNIGIPANTRNIRVIFYWTFSNPVSSDDLTDAYNDGYEDGYNAGYNDGNSTGYDNGYDNGYDAGYDDAYDDYYSSRYQQGFNDGYADANTNPYTFARLFGAVADTPIMIIRNLLGFDVFGVSAMTILMSMITGCIAIFLIRKFIF